LLGAYASVAILCAASLVVGQTILSLCGRRQLTWLAGPVGLAAILVASGVAIKLPGHGTAVAITLAILFALCLAILVARRRVQGADPANVRSRDARTVRCTDAERSPGAHPALAVVAAGLALLVASIPFIVNGRVGILGVGLVNDDMASHLLIADWLNTRVGHMPGLLHHGYPVGPHSLAAGISEGLGTGLIEAFAGITLATPVLTALVAVEALRALRPVPRVLAAAVVALPYLPAAYLAQGAFKEPMEALFLLSFALLLPRATTVRGALPLGVIAAGAVYTYSFPGLFWLAGTAAVWLLAMVAGSRVVGRRPGKLPRMSATSPRRDIPDALRDGARRLLAAALAAGIALSSFLVLHQAPVAPSDHANQLAELRPLVQGHKVLFLGRDNFIAYELRGSRPFTAVRNYYDPNYVQPNLRLKDVFQKFDFDSVTPRTLGRFPFVITTRASYASGPPAAFEPLRETSDFVLWKRTGPVGQRRTLAEGDRPGALLDCSASRGGRPSSRRGTATVFAATPVIGGAWSPSPTVESGSVSSQTLTLPAGRWEISIAYDATRQLRVTAPGLDASLPANLDYRGSVPYYAVGQLAVRHRGPIRFTVGVERPPLAGRLLGTKSVAHLGAIAASPAGPRGPAPGEAERHIPLRDGCGRYLDWYRPASGR
jgi:hypothetical protein